MEIEIPSPSVFLRSPALAANVSTPSVKKSTTLKSRGTISNKQSAKSSATTNSTQKGAITKQKQSKSRNGCLTCKKKRLKCDETKPKCNQCERRNVDCEGYKRDYKWRSFEETSKHPKVGKTKKAGNVGVQHIIPQKPPPIPEVKPTQQLYRSISSPTLQHAFHTATHALTGASPAYTAAVVSPPRRFSPSQFEPLPILNAGFSPSEVDLPSPLPVPSRPLPISRQDSNSDSSYSGGSPNLVDLLLPGTDMRQPPDLSEPRPPMSPLPYQPGLAPMSDGEDLLEGIVIQEEGDEDFDEEVTREYMATTSEAQWNYRASSPALSDVSTTSSKSTAMSILRAPPLDPSSPEMLMLRFDRETCTILSIKDDPSDNPWRTLIWPLAKDSHALYHAISSMAALHGATVNPQLRLAGMAHMTKSISKLSAELHQMRLDQALATSLALALGEGWDDKISTGIQHLRGASTLLNNALVQRNINMQLGQLTEEDAKRLKFLVNTYVYLDVIARLAATEEQDHVDLDLVLQAVNEPLGGSIMVEIDPLMGCATTLFPLIGKVAGLIQRIRKTSTNSLNIVSEANELRDQLLNWQVPKEIADPRSTFRHAVDTAQAYRQAILLHLHQAVPELDSDSSYTQAKEILTLLAKTPTSSHTLIIQIFPLLVGSCEVVSSEDRDWVCRRWEAMMQRLSIVNVVSCWKIVQEVWRRRDLHACQQAQRSSSRKFSRKLSPGLFIPPDLKRKVVSADTVLDEDFFDASGQSDLLVQSHNKRNPKRRMTSDVAAGFNMGVASGHPMPSLTRRYTDLTMSSLDPEYTVRGPLHWLGVMTEWNWEVFLG